MRWVWDMDGSLQWFWFIIIRSPTRQPRAFQVPLLMVMVGNLAEKSLALAAMLTATWRAT